MLKVEFVLLRMIQPLISILTPFKNTELYLSECVESILKQTYENWELMIVDDGSTDDSYKIVNDFAKNDTRIKLFKNTGIGIIDALKLAFDESNGTYITRMDSDDIMMPNKLEVLLRSLVRKGRQHLAIGLVDYFGKDGIGDGYKNYEHWLNNLTSNGTNFSEIYKECVVPSPCWMIHKEDLLACDAFYPIQYPEDYDLAFRFYKHHMICIPCDVVLHRWRDYSTRASRTDEHYAQNYFLEIKLRYFLELEYDKNRRLTVWGAGYKGKRIAKLLKKKGIEFVWICNNPKKIGKHIYGEELHEIAYLNELIQPQIIVAVANKDSQHTIRGYFKSQSMMSMIDYYFFC